MEKKSNAFDRAMMISQKAAEIGFDFPDYHGPVAKIREELLELIDVIENEPGDELRKIDEFGDVLFSVLNLARKIGVDPEEALNQTNKKFQSRFSYVEEKVKSHDAVELAQMEVWWTEAKKKERE